MQRAVAQLGQPVEEQRLDPCVIVEVLEMPAPLDRAEHVRGDRRRTVRADVDAEGVRDVEHARDPEAAGHIELQDVDIVSRRVRNYHFNPQFGPFMDQLWVR